MKQLLAFAEFVRKQYQGIIIGAVLLGLALGLWTSAPGKALQTYSQALTFLMILFISLTITPRACHDPANADRQPVLPLLEPSDRSTSCGRKQGIKGFLK